MSERHVACVVEGDYLPHVAAMLHSLLEHAPSVRIHVLHGPETDATSLTGWLGERVVLHAVPDERVAGLPSEGFTGKATWYRILLPELLPDVDRVLFLDADLIVCDALDELFETDLDGAYVAAVTNVFPPELAQRPAQLGLAPDAYFNAGVLLMNLAEMRRDARTEALLEYGVQNAERLEWRDQDALNVVLGERRLALHPRWNVMNSFYLFRRNARVLGRRRLRQAFRNPAIRHFEGPDALKPWHGDCEQSLRELYLHHRSGTPWPQLSA